MPLCSSGITFRSLQDRQGPELYLVLNDEWLACGGDMPTFRNEVRYAVRMLVKNPITGLFMALVLALGIGANTAIFSMVYAIVLRPLPFRDLDRIVTLSETFTKGGVERYGVSTANFLDWEKASRLFEALAAYKQSSAILTGRQSREQVQTCLVSPRFFSILGLSPYRGRYYSDHTDIAEQNAVVLSYGFWQRRMEADPNIVGKKINLNGLDYDIIGVAPVQLDFPIYTEVWMPLVITSTEENERSKRDLSAIGKIGEGHSLFYVRSEMNGISARLAQQYPLTNADSSVAVLRLLDSVNSYSRSFVTMLMGAVVFVLLMACANVANLQLSSIIMRRKEIALRLSVGASRMQIMRQLVTEAMILSFVGGALGLLIAFVLLDFIKRNMTVSVIRNIAGFMNVTIDWHVLAFTVVASIASAVLFVLPVLHQALQGRTFQALREEGRGSSMRRSGVVRSALVISEVMLAIVLLIGATIMINAFHRITTANRGYDPTGIKIFRLNISQSSYADQDKVKNLYKAVLWKIGSLSGVKSAAMVNTLPSIGDSESSRILVEDAGAQPESANPAVEVRIISEDYFKAMSIPLRAGREFSATDDSRVQPVAIISESAARAFWKGRPALGRRIRLISGGFDTPFLNVVGIAGDVNFFFLNAEIRPTIYLPYQQNPVRPMAIVMHRASGLSATVAVLQDAVQQVDSTQNVYTVRSMESILTDMSAGVRIVAALMIALGLLALGLCTSGVYAIVSYSVAQQIQEIGIRMALGAQRHHIVRLVLNYALRLVLVGLAFGIPVAIALSYVLAHALPGVVLIPTFGFGLLTMLLIAIGILASYWPARRAMNIHPTTALRG